MSLPNGGLAMLGPEEMREYEEHVAHHRAEPADGQGASPQRGARTSAEAPLARVMRAAFAFPIYGRR